MRTLTPWLIAACLAALLPTAGVVAPAHAAKSELADAAQWQQRIAILRRTAAELRVAARQPAPRGLDARQLADVADYDAWLRRSADRLAQMADEGDRLLKSGADAEAQMAFNLQYLQLQSQMQHENRSYTAVSNIMKTKHDTVKNSISNVR